jgi:hypothetical protein
MGSSAYSDIAVDVQSYRRIQYKKIEILNLIYFKE